MKKGFAIIVLFSIHFLTAQNYVISEGISKDSILLNKNLKEIIRKQYSKFLKTRNTDSLKVRIKQEIFSGNYSDALTSIEAYRRRKAINNWEGNQLFSFEVYSKAKLIEMNRKIDFGSAINISIEDKINELDETLFINLKKEIDINLVDYKENKRKNIESLKSKDSINAIIANRLVESLVDFDVFNQINNKALKFLENKIKEKFSTETFEVKTTTGANLTVTVMKRRGVSEPLPVILTNSIYAGDKDYVYCMRAAIRDYVGIVVNTRGKRNSKDSNNPFEYEYTDIYDVIDWISKQKWSNGKVGMVGGSYLGFSQWAATKKLHPALKTIVPQVAVGIGTMDYPMTNNVFMPYMLRWLEYVMNSNFVNRTDFEDVAKWSGLEKKYYDLGVKFKDLDSLNGSRNEIFQRWISHPSQDSYWNAMIPYKNEFSKITIPVLTTTGFWDADQRGAMYYFKEHHKYNKQAQHYLVIGPYDHQTAQNFPNNELYGLELDEVAKVNFINLNFDWFDYVLKDKPKPQLLKDKVNIQVVGTNEWKSYKTLKEAKNKALRFYINPNKITKSIFEKPLKTDYFKQTIDFKIRDEKRIYYSTGKDSTSIGVGRFAIESEVLEKDIIINGSFIGDLKLEINKKDLDIAIDLLQVKPDGEIFYLSDYIGRASYAKDNTKRQLLKSNTVEQIPVKNATFVSKKIEKGSKLVVLFGVSKSKYWQINYGTGKDVSDESILDAKEPLEVKWFNDSYIEIPVFE